MIHKKALKTQTVQFQLSNYREETKVNCFLPREKFEARDVSKRSNHLREELTLYSRGILIIFSTTLLYRVLLKVVQIF
jgi:hypothetical protein